MKLIEKIVDKLLNDGEYALAFGLLSFLIIFVFSSISMGAYLHKLDTEVKLAKIAAGQTIDEKK